MRIRSRMACLVALCLFITSGLLGSSPAAAQGIMAQGVMGEGTEGRDWIDGPAPDPIEPGNYDIEIREHVKIPMRDGVLLDAVLYIPDLPTAGACIAVADGYGWSFDDRDRRFAEERGYAVANVSYRGIDESEGEAGLYDHFGPDGYDMVEWMAAQPWCDGNVGMFGSSLPGIPLWLIAKEQPPSLKAIAPDVACADCYDYLWYPGGMLPGPGRESRARHEYVAAIQHRDYDDWWRAQTVAPEGLAQIAASGLPVLVSGGWEDYITPGNIQAFTEFTAAGGDARLLIAPGAHSSARTSVIGAFHHARHMDLFFDHFLRGEENAWSDGTYRGDAVIWINGPDRYRYEQTWPIPDARAARLHLRAASSGSIESLNDGSLIAAPPAPDEASVSYDHFPQTGPFLPAMRESSGGLPELNVAPYEAATLTWTTGALEVPTEVTGKIVFDFWASATAEDTDFVLMVSDVAPDGTATYVTSGFLNAARHPDRSNPRQLRAGEVRAYTLEAQPTAYVFQEGHRIRFSLAGGAEGTPDQGTPQGPGKSPNFANVTIYQDAQHPSAITIPIVGTARLPTEGGTEYR
ncbi:MAG: CocE/NonD family hydrolase [Gemmatimonadota bacterium]